MKIYLKLFISFVVILLSAKCFSRSISTITFMPEITEKSNSFKNLFEQDRVTQLKTKELPLVTTNNEISCAGTLLSDFINIDKQYSLLSTSSNRLLQNLINNIFDTNTSKYIIYILINHPGLSLYPQHNKCS